MSVSHGGKRSRAESGTLTGFKWSLKSPHKTTLTRSANFGMKLQRNGSDFKRQKWPFLPESSPQEILDFRAVLKQHWALFLKKRWSLTEITLNPLCCSSSLLSLRGTEMSADQQKHKLVLGSLLIWKSPSVTADPGLSAHHTLLGDCGVITQGPSLTEAVKLEKLFRKWKNRQTQWAIVYEK